MAEKTYKDGTKLLFLQFPGTPIQCGVVKGYSPSGKYVGLTVDGGEVWVPANQFSVQEVLSEPADAPAVAAAPAATGTVADKTAKA